jgi:hypothetical protein
MGKTTPRGSPVTTERTSFLAGFAKACKDSSARGHGWNGASDLKREKTTAWMQ